MDQFLNKMRTVLSIGKARVITNSSKGELYSGIWKIPVSEKTYLDFQGFLGDESADKLNHRTLEKAVCGFSCKHHSLLKEELKRELNAGDFGENLSISDFDENKAHLGDVFKIGEAEIQITQPRPPCNKLDFKFEKISVVALFNKLNLGGCYFRVIKPGWVKPVSYMSLKAFGDEYISLYEAANIFKSPTKYEKRVKQIEKLSFVSNSWKELLINKYQLIKGGEKYVSSSR